MLVPGSISANPDLFTVPPRLSLDLTHFTFSAWGNSYYLSPAPAQGSGVRLEESKKLPVQVGNWELSKRQKCERWQSKTETHFHLYFHTFAALLLILVQGWMASEAFHPKLLVCSLWLLFIEKSWIKELFCKLKILLRIITGLKQRWELNYGKQTNI